MTHGSPSCPITLCYKRLRYIGRLVLKEAVDDGWGKAQGIPPDYYKITGQRERILYTPLAVTSLE